MPIGFVSLQNLRYQKAKASYWYYKTFVL